MYINEKKYLCPKCLEPLNIQKNSYLCKNNHCYDKAKQGYVNLVLNYNANSGDDKGMVIARNKFLNQGYYQNLQEQLSFEISKLKIGSLVDAGCGEGYYTNYIAKQNTNLQILGFDLSKYAIKMASSAYKNVSYAIASIANLPLKNQSIDAILSVFAPIYVSEFARILVSGGYFIRVVPGENHLLELKKVLYRNIRINETQAISSDEFHLIDTNNIQANIKIHTQEDIISLFHMTPYFYKSSKEAMSRLLEMQSLVVKTHFIIEVYQKK